MLFATLSFLLLLNKTTAIPLSPRYPFLGARQLEAGPPTCSASSKPWVFAHFKVQNAAEYEIDTWLQDITLAAAAGFDGFALDIGPEAWIPLQVQNAYAAAKASALPFKLFFSFDMTDLSDTSQVLPFVTQYGLHPNQFIYSSRVFASTLAGEHATFDGGLAPNPGWTQLFKNAVLDAGYPSYFVPSFPSISPQRVFTDFTCADGIFSLNAWSLDGNDLGNETDILYQTQAAANSKTYMMPISPNFFIHNDKTTSASFFAQGNEVLRTDNWAFVERWEQAIALQPDFIEVLSWNSYTESDYIGPIRSPQDQPTYAQSFPHTAWLLLCQYYIQRYKTGSFPTIQTDTLVYWYRPHSKNAIASNDPLGRPAGWNTTEDAIYMIGLIASPSLSLITTTGIFTTNSTLIQGVNKVKVEFVEGPISVQFQRNGVTVAQDASGPSIDNTISTYNFNVWTNSLLAP